MLRKWILIVTGIIFFCSCEKGINFKLNASASQLVVDATIENGRAPVVVLSNSLDYFSQIDPSILEKSFVHNAAVSISWDTLTQNLKEYSVPGGTTGYTVYYYSTDSSDLPHAFWGTLGGIYKLKIVVNGQTYTSQTTIPTVAKRIDALQWQKAPANPDTTKAIILATITDPPGYGNYTRYFTSVNDSAFYPGLNSVFDDQITDGTTYSVQVEKGVNRNQKIDLNNYSFFNRGDTVVIKFCNIDKASFDFWRTMEYNYQSIGNPFSTPTQVLGNISNGALGCFCGYGAQYTPIIIPK